MHLQVKNHTHYFDTKLNPDVGMAVGRDGGLLRLCVWLYKHQMYQNGKDFTTTSHSLIFPLIDVWSVFFFKISLCFIGRFTSMPFSLLLLCLAFFLTGSLSVICAVFSARTLFLHLTSD